MEYCLLDTLAQENTKMALVRVPMLDEHKEHISSFPFCMGDPQPEPRSKRLVISMDPKWPGLRLGGVVGNVDSLLLVHEKLKSLIAKHQGESDVIEYTPLTVMNHKKRIASEDYWIINPLGTRECLDLNKTSLKRSKNGKVISVEEYVLDGAKLKDRPAIFRPAERKYDYIVRMDILEKFRETGFADRNVYATPIRMT